ncbi:MAG: hypothetical protein H7296_02740 [Bacteroidia bacterium]|nr:hypothetical protein [Bacteroidia bacterium]
MNRYKVKFEICGIKKFKIIETPTAARADIEIRKLLIVYEPELLPEVPPIVGDDFIKDFFKGFRS